MTKLPSQGANEDMLSISAAVRTHSGTRAIVSMKAALGFHLSASARYRVNDHCFAAVGLEFLFREKKRST